MTEAIEPFHLAIPQAELDDLRERLARTRWPERETVNDWSQGAPLEKVKALCDYWRTSYDWRRCETMLNGLGQYKTTIDGLGIHFLHIRSPEPNALPMIMTHGWPGSVIEFMKVIGPLTDPVAHGGRAEDAFHLVLPSLPGYGFSDKPTAPGWKVERIGTAWIELMRRLGYDRYVAQGGDWGSIVTTALARLHPPQCAAVHINMTPILPQADEQQNMTPKEQGAVDSLTYYNQQESGYAMQQGTRPQTLGYALTDSPIGQAAWIYEKFHAWTDNQGNPEDALSVDEMLDNIMLYWLSGTATSAARLYWESMRDGYMKQPLQMPIGVSIFPKEIFRTSRRWGERYYKNIIHWNELERGGHFAAFEQPVVFVQEVRTCFRTVR